MLNVLLLKVAMKIFAIQLLYVKQQQAGQFVNVHQTISAIHTKSDVVCKLKVIVQEEILTVQKILSVITENAQIHAKKHAVLMHFVK
jgi:hypothetical protein